MYSNLKTFILGCYLAIPAILAGQNHTWSTDSISLSNPNYSMDRFHDLLRYHDPFMYLVAPLIEPLRERTLPLENGEGKNGNWLEGNFAYRFVGYKGKYYSPRFFQRVRITLDAGLMTRLTKDDSSPLLPSNNKFGIGVDLLLSSLDQLKAPTANLAWLTSQIHHYSNGQADTFFIENATRRNNYQSGNFSTNYYRFILNLARANHQRNIIHASLGFQQDFDPGGALGRAPELYNYFGEHRWLASFQFTQRPKRVNRPYFNRSGKDSLVVEKRKQFSFRSELEYIVGSVSDFPSPSKQRVGWHNYITYMPSVTNEVGFFLHGYIGRDYLNIRFDDVVFIGGAGLFVKFNPN